MTNLIKQILNVKREITLKDLFEIKTKSFVVITFLSLLEMVKNNDIYMLQTNNFDDIIISIKDV